MRPVEIGASGDDAEGEALDALRRRLYRADVSADDVARYRAAAALLDTAVPEPAVAEAPEREAIGLPDAVDAATTTDPQPSPRAARRRRLVLGAGAIAVAGLVGVGVLLARPPAPAPAPPAAPALPDVPVQSHLPIPASTRAAFVLELDLGVSDIISTYMYDHPDSRPFAIFTVQRAQSEEHIGTGPGVVQLHPSPPAGGGGRLTVILMVNRSVMTHWTAVRQSVPPDDPHFPYVVTERTLQPVAGEATTATVPYSMPAPTLLTIGVPKGVRWDAMAVYTD